MTLLDKNQKPELLLADELAGTGDEAFRLGLGLDRILSIFFYDHIDIFFYLIAGKII